MILSPFVHAIPGIDTGPMEEIEGPRIGGPEAPVDDMEGIRATGMDGHFTENKGQGGDGAGRFYCLGGDLSVALGTGWMSYRVCPEGAEEGAIVRVAFLGANLVQPTGLDLLPHKSNFFLGNDPSEWVRGARNYERIVYRDLYDSIDLVFHFEERSLKYDYTVRPGGDPDHIRMSYRGVEGLGVDEASGDLVIRTVAGEVRDSAPLTYQDHPEGRREIPSGYVLEDGTNVRFDVGGYERTRCLVIDPDLGYSTYLGGSKYDWGVTRFDEQGNLYIVGFTSSTDFPVTSGAYKVTFDNGFILKLRSDCRKILFSTFIGGRDRDECRGVDWDDDGNVYVCGITESDNFPTSSKAYRGYRAGAEDGFVVRLSANGSSLDYGTYFGGAKKDYPYHVRVDGDGNVFSSGITDSTDLPNITGCYDTTFGGGNYDHFIIKLNHNFTKLVGCSYLGGKSRETMAELELDPKGYPVVLGRTDSSDFPSTPGALQTTLPGTYGTHVTKFNRSLTGLEWSTFLGVAGDMPADAVVDEDSCLYIIGISNNQGFPVTDDAYCRTKKGSSDAYIAKLNESGDRLLYGSYFGGSYRDWPSSLHLTDEKELVFAIETGSRVMPISSNAYDKTFNGDMYDWYVGKINISRKALIYGSYIGGTGDDRPGSVFDDGVNITVTGITDSDDFPTTADALYPYYLTGTDIAIFHLEFEPPDGTVPSPPRNLTAALDERTVTLSWETPSDSGRLPRLGYFVHSGFDPERLVAPSFIEYDVQNVTLGPLSNGITYYYGITAFNVIGESNMSNVVNVTPRGPPLAPYNLTATAGCETVTLTWEPPTSDEGSPILGYVLFRGTDVTSIAHHVDLPNVTEYVDGPLQNGQRYYYRVMTFNSLGNSSLTEYAWAVPIGPPKAPHGLIATPGDGTVSLRWEPPFDNGGRRVLGYKVFRGGSPDSLRELAELEVVTRYTDEGAINGYEYHYCVLAFNSEGDSPRSNIVQAIPRGFPEVPLDMVLERGDGNVRISWGPPAFDGGTPLLGYRVCRGTSADSCEAIADVEGTNYTDEDVLNGWWYFYQVRAYNSVGEGPLTEAMSILPLGRASAPTDVEVEAAMGALRLTWRNPEDDGGSPIVQYSIYRGTDPGSMEQLKVIGPSTFHITDTDLEAGLTYYYCVVGVTEMGEGLRSETVPGTPLGLPGAPLGLTVGTTDGGVILAWNAPALDGGSPILRYVVHRGGSEDDLEHYSEVEAEEHLDASVVNGTAYYYAVAAVNAQGEGPLSGWVMVTPKGPPGEPIDLRVSVDGTSVMVSWTAPDRNGGDEVTGYIVLRGTLPDDLQVIAEVGQVLSYLDEELEPGTYLFSVRAKNGIGTGPQSATEQAIIEKPKNEEGPGFVLAVTLLSIAISSLLATTRNGRMDRRS